MTGLEIVLGALVVVLVAIFKKISDKVGGHVAVLIVFGLSFLMAAAVVFGKDLVPGQLLAKWGEILTAQYAIWGFVVKYLIPQVSTLLKKSNGPSS